MAKATEPPSEAPVVRVVLESFVVEIDGTPVLYAKGEAVHPDDPYLKRWPDKFGPIVFPHPVRRRGILSTPEVRAE
jgi:hypothetical protein